MRRAFTVFIRWGLLPYHLPHSKAQDTFPSSLSSPLFLSNCQTKRPRVPFLAPKYKLVSKEGILERFTKYTLKAIHLKRCLRGRRKSSLPPSLPFSRSPTLLYDTFRFVDTAYLLENETPIFFLSSPEYLTFADETIGFGR